MSDAAELRQLLEGDDEFEPAKISNFESLTTTTDDKSSDNSKDKMEVEMSSSVTNGKGNQSL